MIVAYIDKHGRTIHERELSLAMAKAEGERLRAGELDNDISVIEAESSDGRLSLVYRRPGGEL